MSFFPYAEEFNKYLTYVRNLGFEDTPDYDYLRDLFTQALKNTGEVEDGEYDWMKLNNGKGWEAIKQHVTQHHLHSPNAVPNSSQRELHGVQVRGQNPGRLTADRLNAAQPPPPSPAKAGMGKTRDRPSASGAVPPKRQSGAAGGLNDVVTPAASTQAQHQNSALNLPQRLSQTQQPMNSQPMPQVARQTAEPQLTGFQKLMRVLCCGSSS
jgi:casein kinase 1